jgi:hypothetical protein
MSKKFSLTSVAQQESKSSIELAQQLSSEPTSPPSVELAPQLSTGMAHQLPAEQVSVLSTEPLSRLATESLSYTAAELVSQRASEPVSARAIAQASHRAIKQAHNQASSQASKRIQHDRVARKGTTIWWDPDVHMQLKLSATRKEMTIQVVMEEALDDWFRKHGEHRFLKTDVLRKRATEQVSK